MTWFLLLGCAPIARCCGISKHHATIPGHTSNCATPAEFHGIHSAAGPRAHMRAFKNSIRQEVAKQTLRRVLLGSRVQLRTCQSGLQHRSAPASCCSRSCTQQHRTQTTRNIEQLAGASSIGRRWEQRELLTKANHEAQPRSLTRQMPEAKASDKRARGARDGALADHHSSDSGDAPTGFEESAAPAASSCRCSKRAAMSLLERLQAIRIMHGSTPPS